MRCDLCNGEINIITGSIEFSSRVLGRIIVPSIKHSKCMNCDDISIDYNESKKAHDYIVKKEDEAIKALPIGDFVSLNAAADILGISKQAFSKHSRIKRGFIYSVTIDSKKLYYKKSVEEFRRTGKDGRLLLSPKKQETYIPKLIHSSYIIPITPYDKSFYNRHQVYGTRKVVELFTKCSNRKPIRKIYSTTTH